MIYNHAIALSGTTFVANGITVSVSRTLTTAQVGAVVRELPLIENTYRNTLYRDLTQEERIIYAGYIADGITGLYEDKALLRSRLLSTPEYQQIISGAKGLTLQNRARIAAGLPPLPNPENTTTTQNSGGGGTRPSDNTSNDVPITHNTTENKPLYGMGKGLLISAVVIGGIMLLGGGKKKGLSGIEDAKIEAVPTPEPTPQPNAGLLGTKKSHAKKSRAKKTISLTI